MGCRERDSLRYRSLQIVSWRCFGEPCRAALLRRARRCALALAPQRRESTETYNVPFTRVVYIERTDFGKEDAEDYYSLAPGKAVMLRCRFRAISRPSPATRCLLRPSNP